MTLLSDIHCEAEALLEHPDCILRMSEPEFLNLMQQIVATVKGQRSAPETA
jgi:hypothetical protein